MYLQALQRIICLRQYNGRILFVPAPGFKSYGQPASCSLYKEPPVGDKELGYQGPETKFEDLEWREIKGPFVTIWLHNVPWGAENTLTAPAAKVSYTFLNSNLSNYDLGYSFVVHHQEAFLRFFYSPKKNPVKASFVYGLMNSFLMDSWT